MIVSLTEKLRRFRSRRLPAFEGLILSFNFPPTAPAVTRTGLTSALLALALAPLVPGWAALTTPAPGTRTIRMVRRRLTSALPTNEKTFEGDLVAAGAVDVGGVGLAAGAGLGAGAGQPALVDEPATVGHWSEASGTPSLSASGGGDVGRSTVKLRVASEASVFPAASFALTENV